MSLKDHKTEKIKKGSYSKLKQNNAEKSNIIIVQKEEENPFENAQIENEKIEHKLENDRQKLIDFNRKVKERIKAYKYAEQKLEEDSHLIINKSNKFSNFKKHASSNLNKLKSVSAHNLEKNLQKPIQPLTSFRASSSSEKNLPDFVLRSIIDPNEILKNNKDEYKKRIKSARKIYSNMERDKIKQENLKTENKAVIIPKPVLDKKSKETERFRVERNMELDPSQTKIKLKSRTADLKQFVYIDEPRSVQDNSSVKKEQHVSLKLAVKINSNKADNLDKYIRYMKKLLKEKSSQFKQDLPPLCQCNIVSNSTKSMASVSSLWENDWNKCANNCLFYNNPKEYAKVLLNLLDDNFTEKDKIGGFGNLVMC